MNEKQVIERLCNLCSTVRDKRFNNHYSGDCFCGMNRHSNPSDFRFDEKVFRFIETAVLSKLNPETPIIQQNEELKNKLLAIRCEVTKIADDLWDADGPLEIINRIRKLAE